MGDKDDAFFLHMALSEANNSADPNTKVGCVVVNKDAIVSEGYNCFPFSILEDKRLHDRETKLKLMVHAEMNALIGRNHSHDLLYGATMYTACCDHNQVWGGPPCTRCCVHVIQAGIKRVVTYPRKAVSWWKEDLEFSLALLKEAGVEYEEVEW